MRYRPFARSHYFLSLLVFTLMVSSCAFPTFGLNTAPQTPFQTVSEPTGFIGTATSAIQIYFTDPTARRAKNYRGGPDEILATAIDQANLSVDVAVYNLNLWSVRDALIHAHKRGVVVRMVMESDNMDSQEVLEIKDAGIPIIGDQHEGLMHNKFVVIDRFEVWTGSMNFSIGGAYKDNNNLVRIQSSKVAEDYTSEFEEMFIHRLFGPDAVADTPYPKLNIDGTPVEIYFSPDDKVAARIVALIKGAQESIFFMMYTFTSNDIGNAIMQQAQAGLNVAGVMDDTQVISSQGTEYDPFMQAGLNVRLDGNQNGLMHHKVIIIDQKIVITGSYNLTASAEENNDENVLIIFSPEVAAKFMQEFQRVHDLAQEPSAGPTPEVSTPEIPTSEIPTSEIPTPEIP
jgi:phosphatidylserine/phosphatidylglycerophosphate/cardiolipin synthase-like enzyme